MNKVQDNNTDIKSLEAKNDISGIIEALKSNDGEGAAEALTRLGAPAAELLLEEEWPDHITSIDYWDSILVNMGGKAVEPLINVLNTEHKQNHVGYIVLGKIGDQRALKPLLDTFWKEKSTFKEFIMESIGECRNESTTEFFVDRLLHDPDTEIRNLSAKWLRIIRDRKSLNPLLLAFTNESQISVRCNIALALGLLQNKQAVDPLISAIGDNKDLNTEIGFALGVIGGKKAHNFIMRSIHDEKPEIRLVGISGIAFLGIDESDDILYKTLKDDNKTIKHLSILRLCQFKVSKALDPILEIYLNSEYVDQIHLSVSLHFYEDMIFDRLIDILEECNELDPNDVAVSRVLDNTFKFPIRNLVERLETGTDRIIDFLLNKVYFSDNEKMKAEFANDPEGRTLLNTFVTTKDGLINSFAKSILNGGSK